VIAYATVVIFVTEFAVVMHCCMFIKLISQSISYLLLDRQNQTLSITMRNYSHLAEVPVLCIVRKIDLISTIYENI